MSDENHQCLSPIIIAIDGPAASGKGTIARKLAAHLNFAHMDTGALYRAVGLTGLRQGLDVSDPAEAEAAARHFIAHFQTDQLADPDLRSDETGQAASKVASVQVVRDLLFGLQKEFAACPPAGMKGAVLDGRDIGTVICPDAPAKLFITASDEVRAHRRTKELQSAGKDVTYERVLQDMRERDTRDASRKTAPMQAASDAFVLDTSALSVDQVFQQALDFIKQKIKFS